jgi:MerR family transcriptional regulator, light-induced transcriptional regulator
MFMNLSRLVGIAGFKKKSKQDNFRQEKQQSTQVSDSMWDDCLVSSAPTIANFKKEQESHPLEKACTEAEYLESLVKTIEGKILPHIIERHLESSIPEDLLAKSKIDEIRT